MLVGIKHFIMISSLFRQSSENQRSPFGASQSIFSPPMIDPSLNSNPPSLLQNPFRQPADRSNPFNSDPVTQRSNFLFGAPPPLFNTPNPSQSSLFGSPPNILGPPSQSQNQNIFSANNSGGELFNRNSNNSQSQNVDNPLGLTFRREARNISEPIPDEDMMLGSNHQPLNEDRFSQDLFFGQGTRPNNQQRTAAHTRLLASIPSDDPLNNDGHNQDHILLGMFGRPRSENPFTINQGSQERRDNLPSFCNQSPFSEIQTNPLINTTNFDPPRPRRVDRQRSDQQSNQQNHQNPEPFSSPHHLLPSIGQNTVGETLKKAEVLYEKGKKFYRRQMHEDAIATFMKSSVD